MIPASRGGGDHDEAVSGDADRRRAEGTRGAGAQADGAGADGAESPAMESGKPEQVDYEYER